MRDIRLRNHIPLGAPATREPCDGLESPMRVSLGFTPRWYRDRTGVDFGEAWHLDPLCRHDALGLMKEKLYAEFPTVDYFAPPPGGGADPVLATVSGAFGIMLVSSLYGMPIAWREDGWPDAPAGSQLPKAEIEAIVAAGPFDLGEPASLPGGGPTLRSLFAQMDEIEARWGMVHGYLNYQGTLNVAVKIRGSEFFMDFYDDPRFVQRFLAHIAGTIRDLAGRVQERQRASGFPIDLLSLSNCTVSMLSPEQYGDFVLPLDERLSHSFPRFGIHTCNWNIDPYRPSLRRIAKMGYIDTGMDSDLEALRAAFPEARRAVLYTPGELESKELPALAADFERVARDYAPCDLVLADIETTTPEYRVREALEIAKSLEGLAAEGGRA
jgi:hypothetical protein